MYAAGEIAAIIIVTVLIITALLVTCTLAITLTKFKNDRHQNVIKGLKSELR